MASFTTQNGRIDLANISGDYLEVWGNTETGEIHIVYEVPGSDGELMFWTVPSLEDYRSMLGPGRNVVVNRTVGNAQLEDAYDFGSSIELVNKAKHPFEAWLDQIEIQAQVAPWILEPDSLALLAQAQLEGREVTQAEWAQTEWWKSHTQAERQWLQTYYGDPATARQVLADARIEAANALRAAGIDNAPDALAQLLANMVTTGQWSQAFAQEQIRLMSIGAAPAELDPEVVRIVGGQEGYSQLDASQEGVEQVRQMVRQWLGPAMSGGWDDAAYERWAGRIRTESDAQEKLTALLRNQRKAILPEYEDDSLTYEDIAGVWRQQWQSVLGERPDEMDGDFMKILRANDVDYAHSLLRERGVQRNNGNVITGLLSDMGGTFDPVRRSVV